MKQVDDNPYLDTIGLEHQFKQHAENANKMGELCNAASLKFSYHNHSFDFKPIIAADGKSETTGYQTFIDEFQPELCKHPMRT